MAKNYNSSENCHNEAENREVLYVKWVDKERRLSVR